MTLLRSFIIGLLAIAAARPVCKLLAGRGQFTRNLAWVLLLTPYFTPVLLAGYAYANFSLSLVHHPVMNTIFYSALLWWKFTPIAAVILYFTPSPISPEAIHCRRLMNAGRGPQWIFLVRTGCARGMAAALAVVFLCAFGEFEMASLMGVKSWTVALFDAHAGGLALTESLRRMIGPLLCEAAAVALTIIVLRRHRVAPKQSAQNNRAMNGIAWCHLAIAFVFVVAVPAMMVLWGTVRGFRLLWENFVVGREILSSLLFAAGATVLASLAVFGLAALAKSSRRGSVFAKAILLMALCAGLLGPLVLSLTVLAMMQLPGLISLRDTPVPLVFTLGLVLVPLALVLKYVLELTGHRGALHLTALMPKSPSARELTWRLSTSGKFWTVALLFVWAYWDLTASAILAPIGMTPVTVRLYNLMHYGQIAALSAMTCATFLAPISILLLALATRRWWAPQ
jgi:ABC-type Fe3+ transport system permease subunit